MMRVEIAPDWANNPLASSLMPCTTVTLNPASPRSSAWIQAGSARLLDKDEIRDRLNGHQAHTVFPGLVFDDAQVPMGQGLGQRCALLAGTGDDLLLQLGLESLLRAVGGANERRQTAELEEFIDC